HQYYQCTRVPRAPGRKGRKTFWTYSTRLCLRHVGDVTMVLSKKGRNVSPQHTKILVTNLAELTPSQVVCMYQKRWAIELLNWELACCVLARRGASHRAMTGCCLANK